MIPTHNGINERKAGRGPVKLARLKLFLLGPPRVELDGEEVHVGRRKALALLAYLAVTGQRHSRDSLATLLWPEYDQSRARADLRWTLSLLNRMLGDEWITADRETAGLDPDADLWLDVDAFQKRLAECETHGHATTEVCAECVPLLEEVVGLYRGDFLAGFTLRDSLAFDEWQFFQTQGLRDQLAGALDRLVRWHGDQGEYDRAITYARRWLALDPTHEPVHRYLMALYAQSGQQSAALRQYRLCLRTLEEELDLPPSQETTALYERIRAERARPAEEEAAAPMPPHLPAFLRPAQDVILGEEGAPATLEKPVFVARERELARLGGYLEMAMAGRGQVVFVTGGPGRGKTALMGEFARRAMEVHPELLVAAGTCNAYSGVGDPYLPFREVLGMLTGEVEGRWAAGTMSRDHALRLWGALPLALRALVDRGPSLIGTVVPSAPLLSRAAVVPPESTKRDAAWLPELRALAEQGRPGHGVLEQSAIFQQVTNVLRVLAQAHPLLLLLDDMQWADSGSVGLLFHIGRRLADAGDRILIACAYRPEEVALELEDPAAGSGQRKRHPLDKVLAEFKRSFGDVWVDLRRADEMEGRNFVDAFMDTEPNRLGEDFRNELFQHTGGHPLFTVELLRAMQERGDLVQDAEGRWGEGPALDWERLPARVEAVIEARVGRLDEELRDLLAVASVEGERFTAQVVAEVQGIGERELLRALSRELGARHRLVREAGEAQIKDRFLSRYQFSHALFQSYLYKTLSAGERRLLHGEIGVALERLWGEQTDEIVAQLARHYNVAGEREKAIEYLVRAGEQARLAYANEEAIGHYQQALVLLHGSPLGESGRDRQLEAMRGLGRIFLGIGRFTEAEKHFQEAIALGQEMDLAPRELIRLYHWLGEVFGWQNRQDDRVRIGEEGLALLGDETESVEAALMNQTIAIGYWGKGDWQRAREFTLRTARFIRRLPYTPELRPAYIHIFGVHFDDKDSEEALKWLLTLEERATPNYDLRALGHVHRYAANLLAEQGDLQGAIPRYEQAVEVFAGIGDDKLEGMCRGDMVDVFLSLGDLEKAEAYASRLLKAAESAAHRIGIAPTRWLIGRISLCQSAWEKAVDAFQKALKLSRETHVRWIELWTVYALGQAHLAQGDRAEALRRFKETLALPQPEGGWPIRPPAALSGLEQAYEDPGAFRAFCRRLREEGHRSSLLPLVQWFLEPTEPHEFPQELVHDDFVGSLSPDWVWSDPFGDCSYKLGKGLEIHAANGRDLWFANLSAPRVLRLASGETDWAVQTVCGPISREQPAIGGILFWQDEQNHLRLDRGVAGEHEISFTGCLGNEDVIIGRGQLQVGRWAGRVFLRLERVGDRVTALCSAEGVEWFTVGEVEFPVEDPVQVGLHTIGSIDRTVYHGAYPDGTAIRFESFRLWGV